MKFRAVMQDSQYMREFQSIIMTLSKLAKECVMVINPSQIHFIANEESGTIAPLVWVDIDAKLYFTDYTMDGLATADCSQIMLSIGTANLGRALAALRQSARYCKIKLNKIQFPCLTIETDVISQSSEQSRQIVHDVPVNVIPRCDWPLFKLPQQPACKLILTMPSNRLMRSLIDKIKNLSPTIVFYATSNGEMNLVAETEMATITTRYKKLEVRHLSVGNGNGNDRDKNISVREHVVDASCSVDCKKTAIFFAALQLPTLELSCGIDDEHLIHMEVNVRQGIAIHSILPAVCT